MVQEQKVLADTEADVPDTDGAGGDRLELAVSSLENWHYERYNSLPVNRQSIVEAALVLIAQELDEIRKKLLSD